MTNNYLNYYCFNRRCSVSIYNHHSAVCVVLSVDNALTTDSLLCPLCKEQLISRLEIDLRHAILKMNILPEMKPA